MSEAIRARMQRDLSGAIRARDAVVVKALRAALAAIANAEAVDVASVPCGAGGPVTEVARRHLSDADIRTIVVDEIGELRRSADELRAVGQVTAAELLESQATCLETYLA